MKLRKEKRICTGDVGRVELLTVLPQHVGGQRRQRELHRPCHFPADRGMGAEIVAER